MFHKVVVIDAFEMWSDLQSYHTANLLLTPVMNAQTTPSICMILGKKLTYIDIRHMAIADWNIKESRCGIHTSQSLLKRFKRIKSTTRFKHLVKIIFVTITTDRLT